MGVSTIDGTLEEAVLRRAVGKVRIYDRLKFRLADGSEKSIAKSIVDGDTPRRAGPATVTESATSRSPPLEWNASTAECVPSGSEPRDGVTTTEVVAPGAVVPEAGAKSAHAGPLQDQVSGAPPALVT